MARKPTKREHTNLTVAILTKIHGEITGLRGDVTGLRDDNRQIHRDLSEVNTRLDQVNTRLDQNTQGVLDLGRFMRQIALDQTRHERFHAHHVDVLEQDVSELKERMRKVEAQLQEG